MERVVLFLDYANIDRAARDKNYEVDYAHLLAYMSDGRFLIDAYCYVPIDPRNEHRLDRAIEELWSNGYLVNTKVGTRSGETYKCDFDVEMTMDMLKTVYQIKPDIIILASGDVDFVPLVTEIRKMGIRVEVASFENSASRDLILKCSGFIDLDKYYTDVYLSSKHGAPGYEAEVADPDAGL